MSRMIHIDYQLQIKGKYLLEYVESFNNTKIAIFGNLIRYYFQINNKYLDRFGILMFLQNEKMFLFTQKCLRIW